MSTEKRVTAIFENRAKAIRAIEDLQKMGFGKKNLTLLVAENSWKTDDLKIEENSKTPEGVAVGATAGAAIGAIAAGLTTVGTLAATGGVGLLAAGPIVSAFAGAGAGGATGGLVGGLVGAGYPEIEAKYVNDEIGQGSIMIGVETENDKVDEVKKSLELIHAKKISVH